MMQLLSSHFDVLVKLQREVSLRWKGRQVSVLQPELCIQIIEVVKTLVQLPLASSTAHEHYVEHDILAIDIASLELPQLHLELLYLAAC